MKNKYIVFNFIAIWILTDLHITQIQYMHFTEMLEYVSSKYVYFNIVIYKLSFRPALRPSFVKLC